MTRMNKAMLIIPALTLSLVGGMLFPVTTNAKSTLLGAVCPHIDSLESLALTKMQTLTTTVTQKRLAREKVFLEKRTLQDSKLATLRTKNDTDIDALIASLQKTATTEKERAAIDTFKNGVSLATTEKRSQIDSAIAESRSKIDALITSRHDQIDTAKAKLSTQVTHSISEAKDNCLTGKFNLIGNGSLFDEVQTARRTFVSSLSTTPFEQELSAIDSEKAVKIDAATKTYQAKTKELLANLKAVVK